MTTPSAHVRSGKLLDGLTLQFMRGTSWKGNIFVGAADWGSLGLEKSVYTRLRKTMTDLHQRLGLLHCGVDFAVGTLGGKFGDTIVAAVQDINPESDGCFILARVHGALSHDRRGRCDTRSHSGRHGECRENPLVGIEILNSRTALRGNRRRTRTLGDDRHICANVHASRRASPDHGANACYVATVWHLVKPTAERTTNCSGARPVSTARQPTGGAGGIPGDDGEITIAATK